MNAQREEQLGREILARLFNLDTKQNPLDSYVISRTDEASDPTYYGFVDNLGNWYIMRITGNDTFEYFKSTNVVDFYGTGVGWDNRASLSYDEYSIIFNPQN